MILFTVPPNLPSDFVNHLDPRSTVDRGLTAVTIISHLSQPLIITLQLIMTIIFCLLLTVFYFKFHLPCFSLLNLVTVLVTLLWLWLLLSPIPVSRCITYFWYLWNWSYALCYEIYFHLANMAHGWLYKLMFIQHVLISEIGVWW